MRHLLALTIGIFLGSSSQALRAESLAGVAVQQYQPLPSALWDFGQIRGAEVLLPGEFSTGLSGHFSEAPALATDSWGRTYEVISEQFQLDVSASLGFAHGFQLGVGFPWVARQKGEELPGSSIGSLPTQAPGDLVLSGKWQIESGNASNQLAVSWDVTFPTGNAAGFSGYDRLTFRPRFHFERALGARLDWATDIAYHVRPPQRLETTVFGSEFWYGTAMRLNLLTPQVFLVGEVFGRAGLGSSVVKRSDAYPLEALGTVQFRFRDTLVISIGGGPGLTEGFGTPHWRIVASCHWARRSKRAPPDDVAISSRPDDRDHDNLPDDVDSCPEVAEDHDFFQDNDGCPDPDNDQDRILDPEDECPNEPEYINTIKDEDGCPERDQDADSVIDEADHCPEVPEDADGLSDRDGCPEIDFDEDGIRDEADLCPKEAESINHVNDTDGCPEPDEDDDGVPDHLDRCPRTLEIKNGVQDRDGCPEPDADRDGIVDVQDRCPKQPETRNGLHDGDGCPDSIPKEVPVTNGTVDGDTDGDGVLNALDNCPTVPEDTDHLADDDGCPESDADGDGIDDGHDDCPTLVASNANSTNGCPAKPPEKAARIRLHALERVVVYFDEGSAELTSAHRVQLDHLVSLLEAEPAISAIRIGGHTDETGTARDNDTLSRRRAQIVADYLIDRGIAAKRMTVEGFGASRPSRSNVSEEGRKKNRRVNFTLLEMAGDPYQRQ